MPTRLSFFVLLLPVLLTTCQDSTVQEQAQLDLDYEAAKELYQSAEYRQAEKQVAIIYHQAQKLGDLPLAAKTSYLLGLTQYYQQEYRNSYLSFQRALRLYNRLNVQERVAEINYQIGRLYTLSGNTEKAAQYLLTASKWFEANQRHHALAITYWSIAQLYKQPEKLEEFNTYLKKAEALCANEPTTSFYVHRDLSWYYEQQKQFGKALEVIQKAYFYAQKSQNTEFIAAASSDLSIIYNKTEAHEETISFAQKAITAVQDQPPYWHYMPLYHRNLANALLAVDRREEAFSTLRQVVPLHETIGFTHQWQRSVQLLQNLCIQEGKHQEAQSLATLLQQALASEQQREEEAEKAILHAQFQDIALEHSEFTLAEVNRRALFFKNLLNVSLLGLFLLLLWNLRQAHKNQRIIRYASSKHNESELLNQLLEELENDDSLDQAAIRRALVRAGNGNHPNTPLNPNFTPLHGTGLGLCLGFFSLWTLKTLPYCSSRCNPF